MPRTPETFTAHSNCPSLERGIAPSKEMVDYIARKMARWYSPRSWAWERISEGTRASWRHQARGAITAVLEWQRIWGTEEP
jgi:hypothetical protein